MSTVGRDTKYARVIASAEIILKDGSRAVAERLELKETGETEVRFSWWTVNEVFAPRPLDLTEEDWIRLLSISFQSGVFSQDFMSSLEKKLR